MDIKFDKKSGRILSCTIEGKIKKADDVITINDSNLPDDFLMMFPLGKYFVEKRKVVENKDFKPPEDIEMPILPFQNKLTKKTKRTIKK